MGIIKPLILLRTGGTVAGLGRLHCAGDLIEVAAGRLVLLVLALAKHAAKHASLFLVVVFGQPQLAFHLLPQTEHEHGKKEDDSEAADHRAGDEGALDAVRHLDHRVVVVVVVVVVVPIGDLIVA